MTTRGEDVIISVLPAIVLKPFFEITIIQRQDGGVEQGNLNQQMIILNKN